MASKSGTRRVEGAGRAEGHQRGRWRPALGLSAQGAIQPWAQGLGRSRCQNHLEGGCGRGAACRAPAAPAFRPPGLVPCLVGADGCGLEVTWASKRWQEEAAHWLVTLRNSGRVAWWAQALCDLARPFQAHVHGRPLPSLYGAAARLPLTPGQPWMNPRAVGALWPPCEWRERRAGWTQRAAWIKRASDPRLQHPVPGRGQQAALPGTRGGHR